MANLMTDAQLRTVAEFYKIDLDEARRRNQACIEQGDDPSKPICVGCAKRPAELEEYTEMLGPDDWNGDADSYVIHNEGTYNRLNGHFLCTICYIKNGQPTSSAGWKCP